MINVKVRRCKCERAIPNFGMPGGKATCCKHCKADDMVNLKAAKCRCGEHQPHFGIPGQKAECCSHCKSPDMVDLNSRRCECGEKRSSFGRPGERPMCCKLCKTPDMVDVVSDRCKCNKKQPSFGRPGERPTCCIMCKDADMELLRHSNQRCGSCSLPSDPRGWKNGVCYTCHLGRPRPERVMHAFLQKEFSAVKWVFNKSNGGIVECADKRYRPDAQLHLDGHVVVVECDEDQHKHYDQSCELKRINEILVACGGKPLVMIRWNPDEFSILSRSQAMSERRRLTALKAAVSSAIESAPQQLLKVEYMFYDDERELQLRASLLDALREYLF